MSQLRRALAISLKDVESYYSKPPLITWGLLFPAVLILAIYVKEPGGYLEVAPGIIAMTLLFGNTSMSAIVINFEKRSGTLHRLLLAPVTHRTIILGKALAAGGFGIATALVVTLGLVFLLGMTVVRPGVFAVGLLLGAAMFSLLGLMASSMVREVFEAMTLMNFFRFPLLFISGVFVPLDAMPAWVKPIAVISPLTHVTELLRFGISGEITFPSPWIPFGVSVIFFGACWTAVGPIFRRGVAR